MGVVEGIVVGIAITSFPYTGLVWNELPPRMTVAPCMIRMALHDVRIHEKRPVHRDSPERVLYAEMHL